MQNRYSMDYRSSEDVLAYCEKHGIAFQLSEPNEPKPIIKAYADNFAYNRKQPWTH